MSTRTRDEVIDDLKKIAWTIDQLERTYDERDEILAEGFALGLSHREMAEIIGRKTITVTKALKARREKLAAVNGG